MSDVVSGRPGTKIRAMSYARGYSQQRYAGDRKLNGYWDPVFEGYWDGSEESELAIAIRSWNSLLMIYEEDEDDGFPDEERVSRLSTTQA